ncbi:SRPBCC family protein [Flavobacterium sp. 3HN19-14]|uniref:SRPBCC family protein n=1 Tax=Flavobacterium sp. 3HN19-14 TaxID=3448133 RepID=UPI003EE1ADA5
MKKELLLDFSIDKENKQINVKREFEATLDRVWTAWTEADQLDQWWAPKPYVNKTKSMDFKTDGFWLYSMTVSKRRCALEQDRL